jgi:CAI-1 autoinducer synthase
MSNPYGTAITNLAPYRVEVPVSTKLEKPGDPAFLRNKVDHYYNVRLEGQCGGKHPMKGRVPGAGSIRLRSNDYLCISRHPHLIQTEIDCLRTVGHGDSISRSFLHHYRDVSSLFEERLADLMQAEAAVLVNSGYGANVGLIQSIARDDVPVYIDMKAHISLWEGVRSGGGKAIPIRHNDVGHLRRMAAMHGPGVVVVDAVYSLDGDICPLVELIEVTEEFDCVLVVDETHSFGAMGPAGSGLCVQENLAHRVHFRTIGLSKAVACRGGAIICSERNAEFLRYESIQAIFSTSVLPYEVAGYNAALDIFEREPWRQQNLKNNHRHLLSQLDALGYNVSSSKAQIIALEVGDIQETTKLRDALESRGVFGSIFMPPATPEKRCLMRFTVNCELTDAEISRVVDACKDIKEELCVDQWSSTRRKTRGLAASAASHAQPSSAAAYFG